MFQIARNKKDHAKGLVDWVPLSYASVFQSFPSFMALRFFTLYQLKVPCRTCPAFEPEDFPFFLLYKACMIKIDLSTEIGKGYVGAR